MSFVVGYSGTITATVGSPFFSGQCSDIDECIDSPPCLAPHVCANTLRGKKVDYENDLYDVSKADIVPSGVAELAKLQAEGYTYIKP